MLTLRPYQQLGVNQIRHAFQQNRRAPLYVLSTGGGKTVVFSHIAATVASRSKRVLILVHRIELLRQTGKALEKNGVDHSLINPNYTPDYRKPVQVASVQTLVRRLHHLPPPDLIIVDEAHHATAGTWKKILAEFPKAWVLGVTATPVRGDGIGLGKQAGGIFDELIIGPTVQELISEQYLVKPIVYAPLERLDLKGVKIVRGDYDKDEIQKRVDKPKITGNAVAHYSRLCPGTPAVAFCISVAHAEHVAAEFRAAGFRAYSADGSMDDSTRTRILGGLGNGTVDIVCSCDLISEGTDIPTIGCAILLRPTQSTGLYIQQVGRALRPSPGKPHALILDHVGNTLLHGLPHQDREWSLDGEQKKKRRKGDPLPPVSIRQCPSCYCMHEPGPVCPECNYQYPPPPPPKEVEGELQQVTDEQIIALKRAKRQEVGMAKTLEELEDIARVRGYKPGWAKHIFNSRPENQQI